MKLSRMGITGAALNWFKSYLSERSQCVDINGNISKSRKINGVVYVYFPTLKGLQSLLL
jgi:hypothetical protein